MRTVDKEKEMRRGDVGRDDGGDGGSSVFVISFRVFSSIFTILWLIGPFSPFTFAPAG